MAYSHELFDCSICLQLLEDPVTIACGHSYCIKCLSAFWDTNDNKEGSYSCPECRQTFFPRPSLKRNTLLAALLEEHKGRNSQNAAAAAADDEDDDDDDDDDPFAAPGDVQCDACTGRKRKASMFCLVCLASFCGTHLKPHFEVPPLKKHKLVQASSRIKESICVHHDKLLEIFCRTDQQFICLLCGMDEHKGHDTVSVAAEKCAIQRQLECNKQEIVDRVLNSERKIAELKQAADSIRNAAYEACDDIEQLCMESIRIFICSVEKKRFEMREKVGEAEKAALDWTNNHLSKLQREVLELMRREDQLDQLSLTEDPIQFLQGFQALGDLPESTDSLEKHDILTKFVSAQTDKLKNMCNKEKKELSSHSKENLVFKIPRMSKNATSRKYLLTKHKGSTMEVDPNTIAACLCLSNNNREISWSESSQTHPDHPDRFTFYNQALCKNELKRSHYWEVEWDGGIVDLAVSYKRVERKGSGNDCSFGHNEFSWKLTCTSSGCTFWHNNLHKGKIPPVHSRRVGIHLDYEEGTLSFYSVSDSDTLKGLHQVKTAFTEPLYPGFCVDLGSTLTICKI